LEDQRINGTPFPLPEPTFEGDPALHPVIPKFYKEVIRKIPGCAKPEVRCSLMTVEEIR
jgi:hypothetical protein